MRGGIESVLAGCGGLVRALRAHCVGRVQTPRPPQTPATESAQATLSLSAVLNGGGAALTGGVRWRVFAAEADPDGSIPYRRSSLAQPTLTVPPAEYVVHVAFGLASAAKRVTLAPRFAPSG